VVTALGKHYSVLYRECLEKLTENFEDTEAFFADMTFGHGGHSRKIAEKSKKYKLLSIDIDADALAAGQNMIRECNLGDQLTLVKSNFADFKEYFSNHKLDLPKKLNGILMDLGVSSHHFDCASRGFSFRFEGPLDMRMDCENPVTAQSIVNEYSEEELVQIFEDYGEERFSKRIASAILEKRREGPIETTKDLENIIFHSYPRKLRYGRTHPATRCFQALRIEVNKELTNLEKTIPELLDLLEVGGRLLIISFHSLEDRIVKRMFKNLAMKENYLNLTKKPIIPTDEEINENPRSRSAKLRVIEKQ
jgi:16S rRNA (cytosine1402-N4)-methyltransferase